MTVVDDEWTFRGIRFRRLNPSDDDPQWFRQSINRTVDVVAGDVGAVPRRYVDIGAREHEPLSLVGGTFTLTDRTTLTGYLGTSGTLTSPAGYSGTALLIRADPLVADGVTFRLALEFEFVQ